MILTPVLCVASSDLKVLSRCKTELIDVFWSLEARGVSCKHSVNRLCCSICRFAHLFLVFTNSWGNYLTSVMCHFVHQLAADFVCLLFGAGLVAHSGFIRASLLKTGDDWKQGWWKQHHISHGISLDPFLIRKWGAALTSVMWSDCSWMTQGQVMWQEAWSSDKSVEIDEPDHPLPSASIGTKTEISL